MGTWTNIRAWRIDKHRFQLSSSSPLSRSTKVSRPRYSRPSPRGCRLTRHVRQDAISKKSSFQPGYASFPFFFFFAGGKSPPPIESHFAARLIYFFLSLSLCAVPMQISVLDERVFLFPVRIHPCRIWRLSLFPFSNQYSSHLSRPSLIVQEA